MYHYICTIWIWNVPQRTMLVSSLAILGGGGNFKMWDLLGGLQVIGGMPLKGTGGP